MYLKYSTSFTVLYTKQIKGNSVLNLQADNSNLIL